MTLDLRLALGLLLLAIGLQLAGCGLITDGPGASLNTRWGGGIAAVGAAFIFWARRGPQF